jgi:hypothetical protein
MRRLYILGAALPLLFLIPACGGSDGGTSPTAEDTATADTAAPGDDTAGSEDGDTATGDTEPPADTDNPGPMDPDPIVRAASVSTGDFARSSVALVTQGEHLVACNGATLDTLNPNDLVTVSSLELPATCVAVATDGDALIVATANGQWHRVEDGSVTSSVDAGAPLHLTVHGDQVIGALGTEGLLIGPASLVKAPSPLLGTTDARYALGTTAGIVVAEAAGGVVLANSETNSQSWPRLSTEQPVTSLAAISDTVFAAGMTGVGLITFEVSETAITGLGQAVTAPAGSMALSMVHQDGIVAVADWDRIRLFDVSNPDEPSVIAREMFSLERAASITATGSNQFAVYGDRHITTVTILADSMVPELTLNRQELIVEVLPDFNLGGVGLLVFNTGRRDLHLNDITLEGDRVTLYDPSNTDVEGIQMLVEPGSSAFIEASVEGVEPLSAELSFRTNDPDNANVVIPVQVNPTILKVGEPAPDFLVPTTDGTMVKLSELKGQVVHLKLFNAQ